MLQGNWIQIVHNKYVCLTILLIVEGLHNFGPPQWNHEDVTESLWQSLKNYLRILESLFKSLIELFVLCNIGAWSLWTVMWPPPEWAAPTKCSQFGPLQSVSSPRVPQSVLYPMSLGHMTGMWTLREGTEEVLLEMIQQQVLSGVKYCRIFGIETLLYDVGYLIPQT